MSICTTNPHEVENTTAPATARFVRAASSAMEVEGASCGIITFATDSSARMHAPRATSETTRAARNMRSRPSGNRAVLTGTSSVSTT